ncbi:MAG: hypothetical protein QGH26_03825 [Candidatus Pacebacteria bacterium]|jgi:hypothetical protein|nr:hypothetical protein [Candidatus Paceibacterota bacterium]MDP7159252.1 hypothetical protein [Candidatus Paceibacterota bacterium]
MSKNIKYSTISLRNETYSKLGELSQVVVPGVTLSLPRTVEKLIHLVSNSEGAKEGAINYARNITQEESSK